MATMKDWVEGARLRTLPAAIAPVVLGSATAVRLGTVAPGRILLALGVALLLQIGVNFSNDFSDGIRGTDENRQGPPRLTGGGLVPPRRVLAVALGCFAAAGVLGVTLIALSGRWVLIIVGVIAVLAAWFYTGGRHPYGYMSMGVSELMVFVFFGLFATVGTTWTQVDLIPWWVWLFACGCGSMSVAILMVNNLRDIPSDTESGKRTFAVRAGDAWTRRIYCVLLIAAPVCGLLGVYGSGVHTTLPLFALIVIRTVAVVLVCTLFLRLAYVVLSGATGRSLLPVLRDTGIALLVWSVVSSLVLIVA